MEQSTTLIEIAKAMSKMQGQLKSVSKDATNPFFKSRYATLDAVWDVCRKPLSDNGLSVIQSTYEQDSKTFLETMILHISGEWFKSQLDIRAIKQDPQGIGSAITYARRYAMSAMLGVSSDEDDDGNSATNKPAQYDAKKPMPKPIPPVPAPTTIDGKPTHDPVWDKLEGHQPVPGSDSWIISKVKELKIAEAPFLDYVNKTLHIPVEQTLGETVKKLNDKQRAEVASAINAKEKAKPS